MSRSFLKERRPVPAPTPASPTATPQAARPPAAVPLSAAPGAAHSLSRISITAPGDASEQQADAIAAQVVRMDAPAALSLDTHAPQDSPLVQRKETGAPPPSSHGSGPLTAGGGTPLDPATRAFMEPRFGHDFSHVRVHTDSAASQTAESLSARAFTVAGDITFGPGQYAPGSGPGRELLAHELTHVIQQKSGPKSVQRKPKPGGQPVANHLGRGLNVQSSDIADFTRNASVFLYDTLNRSQDITAQEKAKLGIGADKAGPAESDANLRQVQAMSGALYGLERQLDAEERRVMAQDAQDDPYVGGEVRGPMASSGAGRAMHHQKEALDSDPQVQTCRRELLARKQEFGQVHPILLSAKQDYKTMAEGSTQGVQASAAARIREVEQGIAQTKDMVKSGGLDIWALPELLPQAMAGVGVGPDTPLGRAVLARAASDKNWKTGRDVFLTALGIGLGVASLAVLFGGTMVAGTLGVGGMMTLTGTSLALNTYNAYESVSNFDRNKAQADTSLDRGQAFRHEAPSRFEEVTTVAFALLDLHGLGSEYAGLRATTRRIEEIGAKGPAYIAEHKGAAIAELRQEAEAEFAALSQKNKFPKGMTKEDFVRRVAVKAEESLAREAETRLARARDLRRARAEEQRLAREAKGLPTAEAQTLEGQAARRAARKSRPQTPAPQPTVGPQEPTYPTSLSETAPAPKPVATYDLDANGVPFARHTKHTHPRAAPAEPVPAAVEPPRPEIKTTPDGSQVTVAEDGSKTITMANGNQVSVAADDSKIITYADGTKHVDGQGWTGPNNKPVTLETVYRDQGGNKISREAYLEANGMPPLSPTEVKGPATAPDPLPKPVPAESVAPPAPAGDSGVSTSMRDAFEKSTRKSEAVRDALAQPTTEAIPVSAEKTLLAPNEGKILHDTERGAVIEKVGNSDVKPHQDPTAEFPAGSREHAPTVPVTLADLTEIDATRANLDALKERSDFSLHDADSWTGGHRSQATGNVAELQKQIGDAETKLKVLEAQAGLPIAADLKTRLADPQTDPIALINQNQSWQRLTELGVEAEGAKRLLAARDATLMRLKTMIEQKYNVFIHDGGRGTVVDKVTAGKLGTDVDLVVSSRAPAGGYAEAGEGAQTSQLALARQELQDLLNKEFGGDSNRVAMVNVFMADQRLEVTSLARKATQDRDGVIEGLRGLQEVDPAAYNAQKAALTRDLPRNEKGEFLNPDDPRLKLLGEAEGQNTQRLGAIDAELRKQGVTDPAQATDAQTNAARDQVRQQKEQAAEAALHEYEAARGTATDVERDALAGRYNKAVQDLAMFTPEAYTPHGALEVSLVKREIATGMKNGRPLTPDVAPQATLGETRMLLDVLDKDGPATNKAAHCAKYLGRFLNQATQVLDLDQYPMISRLRSNPEAFQAEMVAVKNIGDEPLKVRSLLDFLGDGHRDPNVVAGEFINQCKQMMYDLNARLITLSPAALTPP